MAEPGPAPGHNLRLSDRSKAYPGTEKHPQGRLFAPVGNPAGDPWKHTPENWMQQSDTPSHSDIVSWHASESSQLPRYDDPDTRQLDQYAHEGADWDNHEIDPDTGEYNDDYTDFSVDDKDRPMSDYGSAVGMHFGDVRAASERPGRDYAHPVRIPRESLVEPLRGNFSTPRPGGSIAAGPYKSNTSILNQETGERTPDWRWSDSAANFANKATDLVESGRSIAYRNDVEAPGSTSYRTLPETVRTWGEDVLEQKTSHPAMRAAAEQGYNPVQRISDKGGVWDKVAVQPQLPGTESHPKLSDANGEAQQTHHLSANVNLDRIEHFNRGRAWSLQKPTVMDAWDYGPRRYD